MNSNISVLILIASFCGICWRVYHIGWDEGFDCGWKAGRTDGWFKAAEFYREVLDKLWKRLKEE